MVTKAVDSRGRLTLGPAFANKLVIIRPLEGGAIQIIPAEAVPAREAWLSKDPKALLAVMQGLEEARSGRLVESPDLDADGDWADREDDE